MGQNPVPPFEVRASPIQGQGVFATRRIRRGARLLEYTGERISHAEANQRYDDDAVDHPHTFLFTVSAQVVIDAAVDGNAARFINHSCAPNCQAVDDEGRIFIEAARAIRPGEELAYDYQLERAGRWRKDFAQRYACRCGAPNCRGVLLLKPKRPRRPARALAA
ncbi:MAG: SET domain-containing protein-lysine N-methyltransferase [Anaerolineales bacterium]|nr:SET domain-containing protein-lysine N-methyltransferase [Anaerolineales bacterium]